MQEAILQLIRHITADHSQEFLKDKIFFQLHDANITLKLIKVFVA